MWGCIDVGGQLTIALKGGEPEHAVTCERDGGRISVTCGQWEQSGLPSVRKLANSAAWFGRREIGVGNGGKPEVATWPGDDLAWQNIGVRYVEKAELVLWEGRV